tara:strand:+ start:131 stop:415 length:285 start_codon:yes stop_codon:yes gene_type:complete
MDIFSNLFGPKKPKPKSDYDVEEGKFHHPTKTRPKKPKKISFPNGNKAYRDFNVGKVNVGGRKRRRTRRKRRKSRRKRRKSRKKRRKSRRKRRR